MAQRRYSPISTNPEYNRYFDVLKVNSQILSVQKIPNVSSINLDDLRSLRYYLYLRTGDSDGIVEKDRLKVASMKKAAQDGVKAVHDEFAKIKQTTINQGRPVPSEMPKELKIRLWKAEATLDIVAGEIEQLEKLIKELESKKADSSSQKVLQHGPIGSGVLRGGILFQVDGQRVGKTKKGELFIDDPRSKYNGMLTADYFSKIVIPWKQANAELLKEYLKKAQAGEIDSKSTPKPRVPWPDPLQKERKAA